MKTFIFILTLCLLLTGCSNTLHYPEREQNDRTPTGFSYDPADDKWLEKQSNRSTVSGLIGHGDFLYFSIGQSPVRFNTTSGVISYLCPDPLCLHDSSACPFFGVSGSQKFHGFIRGNSIYYPVYTNEDIYNKLTKKWEKNRINQFRKYDIPSGKLEILIRDFSHGGILEYMVCEDYLYSYHQEMNDDHQVRYYISQYDMKRGTTEQKWLPAAMDGLHPYNLIDADDTYLYLAHYLEGALYRVPHDHPDQLTQLYSAPEGSLLSHTVYNDGMFLFLEENADKSSCRLVSYAVADQTAETAAEFAEPIEYLYYTENYAYYTYARKKEIGMVENEQINLSESVVYRVPYKTPDAQEEKIFEFSEDMATYALQNFSVSGNYLYAYYYSWGEKKEIYQSEDGYNSSSDSRIMRIDLRSGEIYYIEEN